MSLISIQVNNVKGAFLCSTPKNWSPERIITSSEQTVIIKKNFIVIRGKHIFVFFPDGLYVNFTKLKNHKEIDSAIREFENITNLTVDKTSVIIHNITAHGKFKISESLPKIKRKVESEIANCYCVFNTSYLPGLLIKTLTGTAVLYQSGAIKFLGFNSRRKLKKVLIELCACITKKL